MCRLMCHCVRHIGLDDKHGRSVEAIHSFLSRWRLDGLHGASVPAHRIRKSGRAARRARWGEELDGARWGSCPTKRNKHGASHKGQNEAVSIEVHHQSSSLAPSARIAARLRRLPPPPPPLTALRAHIIDARRAPHHTRPASAPPPLPRCAPYQCTSPRRSTSSS